MSVNSEADKLVYLSPDGPDALGPYQVPPYVDPQSVFVAVVDAGGVIRPLTLNEDYSLVGADEATGGVPGGGSLFLAQADLAPNTGTGQVLVIQTRGSVGQPVTLPPDAQLDVRAVELGLDHLAVQQMALHRTGLGAVRIPYGDPLTSLTALPSAALRAGTIPYFVSRRDAEAGRGQLGDLRTITPAELVALAEGREDDGSGEPVKPARLSAADIGLKGDGSDETATLRAAIVEWGGRGGAIFDLRPPPGGQFYFADGIYVDASNIHLQFSGPPVLLGGSASIVIEGRPAYRYATPIRLGAAATTGATTLTLDTLPLGSGALSQYMQAGDWLELRGPPGSSGRPAWRVEVRVQSLTTSTVTIHPALPRDMSVDATSVMIMQSAELAVGAGLEDTVLTVGQSSLFGSGQWVELASLCTAAALAGGSSEALVATEVLRVDRVNVDGLNTVRLARGVSKAYSVAHNARLVRLDAVYGSSVSGLIPQYTGPADAGLVPVVHIDRAIGCAVSAMSDTHGGDVSHRGPTVLVTRSANTLLSRINAGPARYVDNAGEGDGVHLGLGATSTRVVDFVGTGLRRGIVIAGAVDSVIDRPQIDGSAEAALVLAGLGESRTVASAPVLRGGGSPAQGLAATYGIVIGSLEHGAGPYTVQIDDAVIEGFRRVGEAAIWLWSGADDVTLADLSVAHCAAGIVGANAAAVPTRAATRISVDYAVFDRVAGWAADLDGLRNGGSARGLRSISLRRLRVVDGTRGVRLLNLDTVSVLDLDLLDGFLGDVSEPYTVYAVGCLGLGVYRLAQRGGQRGVWLQSCPAAFVTQSVFTGLVTPYVLADGGGNTGMVWALNITPGMAPQLLVPGTPSSGAVYWPLAITPTADFRTLA